VKLRRGFWIALTLFAGLLAWIRWYESRRPLDEAPAETPYFAVEPTTIASITVAFPPDTTVLAKRNGTWWIESPVDFPADPTAVEALLSRCRDLETMRRFAMEPGQESRYGFQFAGGGVTLHLEDGTDRRLTIGSIAVASPAFYVRADSADTIALVRDSTIDNFFRKRPDGWRDPKLLDFRPTAARTVRLASGRHLVVLERGGDGLWSVTEPFPGPCDPTATAEFLKGLAAMKARSWPDDHPVSLAPWGLDRPVGTLSVVDTSGAEQRLEIGAPLEDPKLRAAVRTGRPEIYGVPDGYLDLARRSDFAFRRKHLFTYGLKDVTEILLAARGDTARFDAGADGGWRLRGEESTPGAPPPDRTEIARNVLAAAADSIASAAALPASGPTALLIEIRGAGGLRSRIAVGPARTAGGREMWPARFTFPDHERASEVLLLSPDLVRPLLALLNP